MSRRSLPILLVLLAVIATGVVWLAGVIGKSTEDERRSLEPAARSREVEGTPTQFAAELAQLPPEKAPRTAPVESAPSSGKREGVGTSEFDPELADAIWVEGRVVFPAGTPADEHVEVVAEGTPFESRDFHRAATGPDGSFRVAFAHRTQLGVLRLDARYLYLEEYRVLSPPTNELEIVLRPTLGGCIQGRVLLPLSGTAQRSLIVGCSVSAFTHGLEGFFAKEEVLVTTAIDEDLRFEMCGVPSRGACVIKLRSSEVSLPTPVEVQVDPGRVSTVDLLVETNAKIAGVVVAPDGQPARGSTVRARKMDGRFEMHEVHGPEVETRTDLEGRFELPGVAAGTYQVWAAAADAVDGARTELELVSAQRVSDLTLRLSRGGRIVGQVIDADGRPDPGVEVVANSSGGTRFTSGTADDQGRFEIGRLVPGEYELRTRHRRKSGSSNSHTIEVSARSTVVRVEDGQTVQVVIGGKSADSVVVRGVVRRGGKPAADWRVIAIPLGGLEDGISSTTCDGDGTYRIVLDHPGWFTFSLGSPKGAANMFESVEVPSAKSFERNFDVTGDGRLSGRVLDEIGAAAPSIPVTAIPGDGASRLGGSSFFGQATTNEVGEFTFEGLPEGTYRLEASRGSVFGNESTMESASLEGIRLGETESVNGLVLTFQKCCSIKVTLRRADGKAVSNASVGVRGQADIGMSYVFSSRSPSSPTCYELKGVRPGEITVTANTEDPPMAGSATVVLAPGEKGKVEIDLQPATTLLVRLDPHGRDAREISVVVRDRWSAARRSPVRFGVSGAASEGSDPSERRFGPLSRGRYTILAEHPDGSSAQAEVEITGGSEQVVLLRLEP